MEQIPPPLEHGMIGELFWKISDPVLIVSSAGIEAINPAAERVFGVKTDAAAKPGIDASSIFGPAADRFEELVRSTASGRLDCSHLDAHFFLSSFIVDEVHKAVVLRDVTAEERHVTSLRRLNEMAREVLIQDSVEIVLQRIVDEAKDLTAASFSALLMLKEGSDVEVSKFVYNAPRELFPDRLPRAIGLLAVPIQTRSAARLDDIRGHPGGVGIPVEHPPIGPLLAVPIIAGADVLGELAVANQPGERFFNESDEAVLTDLGLLAVQAIRLAQAREVTAASEASRQAMLDLLRHDMMTPIATAKGAADLLTAQFHALNEEQRTKLLTAIGRAMEAIERLGRNLRSDARLDALRIEQEFTDIEVIPLVNELEEDLRARAEKKGVKIDVQVDPECPEVFRGAYLLVRQALENLITNAIRFSPDDDKIVVTSRLEGESIRFDIQDGGPGIPLEEQSELFVRFFRGRRKDDPGPSGLGLGLSIVKRVAEAHGGAVGLASQPGQGSTFWITFPLAS